MKHIINEKLAKSESKVTTEPNFYDTLINQRTTGELQAEGTKPADTKPADTKPTSKTGGRKRRKKN